MGTDLNGSGKQTREHVVGPFDESSGCGDELTRLGHFPRRVIRKRSCGSRRVGRRKSTRARMSSAASCSTPRPRPVNTTMSGWMTSRPGEAPVLRRKRSGVLRTTWSRGTPRTRRRTPPLGPVDHQPHGFVFVLRSEPPTCTSHDEHPLLQGVHGTGSRPDIGLARRCPPT